MDEPRHERLEFPELEEFTAVANELLQLSWEAGRTNVKALTISLRLALSDTKLKLRTQIQR